MTTTYQRRPARLIAGILLALALSACGGASLDVVRFDGADLLAERDEWRGDKTGRVYLRRHVQGVVDTAVDPSAADSALAIHVAITRFAGAPDAEHVRFIVPSHARRGSVTARLIAPDGAVRELDAPPLTGLAPDAARDLVDPYQRHEALAFPPLAPGEVLEIVATWPVPGTLVADARWIAADDGPTHEVLFRYDLADDAAGTFRAVADTRYTPIVTKKDGTSVIALLVHDVPARAADDPAAAHVRYVTTRVAPKNYETVIARAWADVARPYTQGLLVPSKDLREGYDAPFVATGAPRDRVDAAYAWVRDRLQRADALDARWDAAKPLVTRLETNDLDATDKVHLLHWLLDAADVPHVLAVARAGHLPPIPADLPTPYAFDRALVYVPSLSLWLDPACRDCAPGQVRPELRAGQALLLPGTDPPTRLPE